MASRQNLASRNALPVQDRIHFVGIIHSKIAELKSEIQRLQREKDSFVEDNQEYIALSKTVKDLSQQTEDLRNELEDYNMARMNSFSDVTELKKEIDDLHAHNQQIQSAIDELILEKQRKQERIQLLENDFYDDRPKTGYKKLDSTSDQFQYEISSLESQMNKIREQVSSSTIHQEALSLIDQIYELEHLKLTTKITDDNQEYVSIEQQIIELEKSNEDLEQTHEQCSNDIKTLQQTNLTLLSFISRALIQDNYIQIEKQNSDNTLIILAEQHRKLKQDFIKLENLDQRLTNELQELKLKYSKIQEDLIKFNDLEQLKRQAEKRKQQLITNKINMIQQKQTTQLEIQTLQSQFETMQRQLQDNETHQQMVSLERKLQTLFSLDEQFSSEPEYEQIKHQALNLVYAHNQWLIDRLKKSY